jgi:hypothetical protein
MFYLSLLSSSLELSSTISALTTSGHIINKVFTFCVDEHDQEQLSRLDCTVVEGQVYTMIRYKGDPFHDHTFAEQHTRNASILLNSIMRKYKALGSISPVLSVATPSADSMLYLSTVLYDESPVYTTGLSDGVKRPKSSYEEHQMGAKSHGHSVADENIQTESDPKNADSQPRQSTTVQPHEAYVPTNHPDGSDPDLDNSVPIRECIELLEKVEVSRELERLMTIGRKITTTRIPVSHLELIQVFSSALINSFGLQIDNNCGRHLASAEHHLKKICLRIIHDYNGGDIPLLRAAAYVLNDSTVQQSMKLLEARTQLTTLGLESEMGLKNVLDVVDEYDLVVTPTLMTKHAVNDYLKLDNGHVIMDPPRGDSVLTFDQPLQHYSTSVVESDEWPNHISYLSAEQALLVASYCIRNHISDKVQELAALCPKLEIEHYCFEDETVPRTILFFNLEHGSSEDQVVNEFEERLLERFEELWPEFGNHVVLAVSGCVGVSCEDQGCPPLYVPQKPATMTDIPYAALDHVNVSRLMNYIDKAYVNEQELPAVKQIEQVLGDPLTEEDMQDASCHGVNSKSVGYVPHGKAALRSMNNPIVVNADNVDTTVIPLPDLDTPPPTEPEIIIMGPKTIVENKSNVVVGFLRDGVISIVQLPRRAEVDFLICQRASIDKPMELPRGKFWKRYKGSKYCGRFKPHVYDNNDGGGVAAYDIGFKPLPYE